jgi:hypothetical protein
MLQNLTKDDRTKYSINKEIAGINKKIRAIEKSINRGVKFWGCGKANIVRNANQFAKTIKRKTSILEAKIEYVDTENERLRRLIAYQVNRGKQFKEIIRRGY